MTICSLLTHDVESLSILTVPAGPRPARSAQNRINSLLTRQILDISYANIVERVPIALVRVNCQPSRSRYYIPGKAIGWGRSTIVLGSRGTRRALAIWVAKIDAA